MGDNADGVKKSIDLIIGSDTTLTRRKKTAVDVNRDLFYKIILSLEQANTRSFLLEGDFALDLTKYDDIFYEAIDNLIVMHFGKEAAELVFFYLYDRLNPDGSINVLLDPNGTEIVLQTPEDLWLLIQHVTESLKVKKK
jgi:hypothetical protein